VAVQNPKKLAEAISTWIFDQAKAAGARNVVFGLSGGVDSALVALLCKRVFPDAVGVNMPCHSSGSALERARELATKIGLKLIVVDLSKAHESIAAVVGPALSLNGLNPEHSNGTEGALRSCLRAPTLDYVAKKLNAMIIGTGNRDEDEMTRYFQKRGDGCVDISPIAKLHKSEVYELAAFLDCTESILKATPTADLWGPDSGQADEKQLGLTYAEIEWGIREWDKHAALRVGSVGELVLLTTMGILSHSGNYDERQRFILSSLIRMEVTSRHKANSGIPVFNPREIPGLLS
jgi:NAD+ synthase